MKTNPSFDPETLKYDAHGLIPAIVTDRATGDVLMLAYMNRESLSKTLETGTTWFWSRSRKELWNKGATSGHTQRVVSIEADCDRDTLLVRVEQTGVACHTGAYSCFFDHVADDGVGNTTDACSSEVLTKLAAVLAERKATMPEGSYTTKLLEGGPAKILKKFGEETTEFVMACTEKDRGQIVYEAGDVFYHMMVALTSFDIPIADVFVELDRRFGTSGIAEKQSRAKK